MFNKFGRHLGSFFILKYFLNRYLAHGNGESVLSMQGKLFVKTCLIEDEFIKEGGKVVKTKQNTTSKFLFDQIFGASLAKLKILSNKIKI